MLRPVALAAYVGLACLPSVLHAQGDDPTSRATLAGLAGVQVVVEALPQEAEQRGLSQSNIQTDAELALRMAGIRVLTENESLQPANVVHLSRSDVVNAQLRWHGGRAASRRCP